MLEGVSKGKNREGERSVPPSPVRLYELEPKWHVHVCVFMRAHFLVNFPSLGGGAHPPVVNECFSTLAPAKH